MEYFNNLSGNRRISRAEEHNESHSKDANRLIPKNSVVKFQQREDSPNFQRKKRN